MNLKPFKLERYFAKHEFTAKILLCSSDCDSLSLSELLSYASEAELEAWNNIKLGYTETQGTPNLRLAIAQHYSNIKIGELIIASPGELSFAFMHSALRSGDHIICMFPAYQSLYEIAETIGCEVTFWTPNRDGWHFDVGDLAGLIRKNTKAIIVNFPHNPSGFVPDQESILKLIDLCRSRDLILFSDEMYRRLTLANDWEIPPLCDLYENAISLWGMSKGFGLAGLRVGWLALKNKELLQQILAFKDYLSLCTSPVTELLTTIALSNADKLLTENVNRIATNYSLFTEFQSEHRNVFGKTKLQGGTTALVPLLTSGTSEAFCDTLVASAGIMLLPSEVFGLPSGFVRIGFGRKNFPEGLSLLDNFLTRQVQ
jgi:aspartate/methionine/tyrosine aminotransferase